MVKTLQYTFAILLTTFVLWKQSSVAQHNALAHGNSHHVMDTTEVKDARYEMFISPNPVENELLTIRVNTGNKNVKFIRIYDLIGKEVAFIDLSNKTAGTYKVEVDFSHIKPGMYFCNIYSDKGLIETKKIQRIRNL
ncbi:MAG: T9SS type A sorting domain-containing protein [Cytophagaceae bacterium]